ncbi:MAG: alpha/beta hydrolase [Alphaproteobacteria bacterium]|nr:alpha/beta hydrolase [Alphaproteobacteria bacterium]
MRPDPGSFPYTDENGTVWLAFMDFGARARDRVVVCVHGLTRQGRDFDRLATAMARDFRVIEVDVAGRGRSGWLADKTSYTYPTYLKHAQAFLDYRGLEQVDWVGTSMGGLMGMMLAVGEDSPVRRLVLNDVGPFIPASALEKMGSYVGQDPRFANLQEALAYFQEVYAEFGVPDDAAWSELVLHSISRQENGTYALHYDPAIGDIFKQPLKDVDLWGLWDQITCPVLVLRGAESKLLTRETAEEMTRRGPKAELVEFEGCGHAPALMTEDQISVVHEWLLSFDDSEPEEDAQTDDESATS